MHTIDAQEKSLGRVASEAATLLRGKDNVDYTPHVIPTAQVKIVNASKLAISERKMNDKVYRRYTGYPSGLREEKLGRLIERRGYSEVIRRAVHGMLASNKLRKRMLNNLIIED